MSYLLWVEYEVFYSEISQKDASLGTINHLRFGRLKGILVYDGSLSFELFTLNTREFAFEDVIISKSVPFFNMICLTFASRYKY